MECGTSDYVGYIRLETNYVGTLAWSHMPHTTKEFSIWHQKGMTGRLFVNELPIGLNSFVIPCCSFFGTVDLTELPSRLTYLNLRGNQFSGDLDLTLLPPNLTSLYLNGNEFDSVGDLSKLPASLVQLFLRGNKFSRRPDVPFFVSL